MDSLYFYDHAALWRVRRERDCSRRRDGMMLPNAIQSALMMSPLILHVITSLSVLNLINVIARSPSISPRRVEQLNMWTLVSSSPSISAGSSEFSLPNEGTAHIVVGVNSNYVEVVRAINLDVQRELGRIGMFFLLHFPCAPSYIASRRTIWCQGGSGR